MPTQVCPKCKIEYDSSQFRWKKYSKRDPHGHWCRSCSRASKKNQPASRRKYADYMMDSLDVQAGEY